MRTSGCRRCRPDAPPAALACAACDHRPRLGPSRFRICPRALRELADRSRVPCAEARPQGRRIRPTPGGRRLQPGWDVTPDGLRLLGPRVRGLPLDRLEAPALELGSAARGPAGSLARLALAICSSPRAAATFSSSCRSGRRSRLRKRASACALRAAGAVPAGVRLGRGACLGSRSGRLADSRRVLQRGTRRRARTASSGLQARPESCTCRCRPRSRGRLQRSRLRRTCTGDVI